MPNEPSHTQKKWTAQGGPISGDMRLALQGLAELLHLLPDDKTREARQHLHALFNCSERVMALELTALPPQGAGLEAAHVQ